MAERYQRLEISDRVLDLGSRVVPLAHVASFGSQVQYPLRPFGLLLLLGTAGLLGSEAMNGRAAFSLSSGGSFKLWLGFGLAGLGAFLVVFARRSLVLETSGGSRIDLGTSNEKQAADVIAHVRGALDAKPGSARRVRIDLATGAAEVLAPADPSERWDQDAAIGLGATHEQPLAGQVPYRNGPPQKGALNGAAGAPVNGNANGHYGAGPTPGPGAGMPTGGAVPAGSRPAAAPRPDPVVEVGRLMDLVMRSGVQHRESLVELLRVVDQHLRGGPVTRDDALAHWQSFSEYVHQYLRNVDGLAPQTDRLGKLLGR
jgi:hypothetical protein